MADFEESPEEFAEKMDAMVEHTVLAHGISMGTRVGLFKCMSDLTEPKTSTEIAAKAGLNERYFAYLFLGLSLCFVDIIKLSPLVIVMLIDSC